MFTIAQLKGFLRTNSSSGAKRTGAEGYCCCEDDHCLFHVFYFFKDESMKGRSRCKRCFETKKWGFK
jgi:hypothetical protein